MKIDFTQPVVRASFTPESVSVVFTEYAPPIVVAPPDDIVTWNPDATDPDIELSNGNLTATLVTSGPGIYASGLTLATHRHGGEPRCFAASSSGVFGCYMGFADENVVAGGDVGDVIYGEGVVVLQTYYGAVFCDGSYTQYVVPGNSAAEWIAFQKEIGDGVIGVWFDTVEDLTLADREAGTNPHGVITPAGEFVPMAVPANLGTAITLNPEHSSGTFDKWSKP